MPRLVCGIGGPSGSGKTTLATRVCARLEEQGIQTVIVPEDRYFIFPFNPDYRTRDPRSETPENVDWLRLCADIERCLDSLQGDDAVVLVEHFLLLAHASLLAKLDLALVLDGDKLECKTRRLSRQVRTPEQTEALSEYYDRHVWPGYLRYTKSKATELLATQQSDARGVPIPPTNAPESKMPMVGVLDATMSVDVLLQEALAFLLSQSD